MARLPGENPTFQNYLNANAPVAQKTLLDKQAELEAMPYTPGVSGGVYNSFSSDPVTINTAPISPGSTTPTATFSGTTNVGTYQSPAAAYTDPTTSDYLTRGIFANAADILGDQLHGVTKSETINKITPGWTHVPSNSTRELTEARTHEGYYSSDGKYFKTYAGKSAHERRLGTAGSDPGENYGYRSLEGKKFRTLAGAAWDSSGSESRKKFNAWKKSRRLS